MNNCNVPDYMSEIIDKLTKRTYERSADEISEYFILKRKMEYDAINYLKTLPFFKDPIKFILKYGSKHEKRRLRRKLRQQNKHTNNVLPGVTNKQCNIVLDDFFK